MDKNIKSKSIKKTFEENIEYRHDLGVSKDFLSRMQKALTIKEKKLLN